MHLADVATGNLGANGIVAGGIPIAAGAALAYRLRGEDRVVACFFGDGATNEGAFHEAVNLAAIWKLPVVFICENNKYGMSFSTEKSMASRTSPTARRLRHPRRHGRRQRRGGGVRRRAGRGGPGAAGEGPTLVENLTYRWKGHSKSDKNLYRTREEIAEWRAKDPILRFEARSARPESSARTRSTRCAPRRWSRCARPSAPPTPPPTPTPPTCSTRSSPPPDPRAQTFLRSFSSDDD